MANPKPEIPRSAKASGPKKVHVDSAVRGKPYTKTPAATAAGSAIPSVPRKTVVPLQGKQPNSAPSPSFLVGRSLAISKLGQIPSAPTAPIPVVAGPEQDRLSANGESTATVAASAANTVAGDPQAAIPSRMEEGEDFVVVSRKRRNSQSSRPASPKRVVPSTPAVASSSQGTPAQVNTPAPKIPPIVVPLCPDWHTLLRSLRNCLPSGIVDAKFQGGGVRIFPRSIDDFRACQKILTEQKRNFHTFALPEERELKVVVSGIPSDTPPSEICGDLEEQGFSPTSCSVLKTARGVPVNAFLVKLRKVGNFADIYKVSAVLYLRVQVRSFNNRPGPPQCFNCQRFGHSSVFCHMAPRCVRCGGDHRGNCPVSPETAPTCCNCSGSHPANYRGCNGFKKALTKQREGVRKAVPPRSAPQPTRREAVPPPASASTATTTASAAVAATTYAAAAASVPAVVAAPQTSAGVSQPHAGQTARPKPKRSKKPRAARQPVMARSLFPEVTPTSQPGQESRTPVAQDQESPMETSHSEQPALVPVPVASAQSPTPAPRALESRAPAISGCPLISEARLMAWVSGIIPQILAARDVPSVLTAILTSLIGLLSCPEPSPLNG